jgi:hypothetical protein
MFSCLNRQLRGRESPELLWYHRFKWGVPIFIIGLIFCAVVSMGCGESTTAPDEPPLEEVSDINLASPVFQTGSVFTHNFTDSLLPDHPGYVTFTAITLDEMPAMNAASYLGIWDQH